MLCVSDGAVEIDLKVVQRDGMFYTPAYLDDELDQRCWISQVSIRSHEHAEYRPVGIELKRFYPSVEASG